MKVYKYMYTKILNNFSFSTPSAKKNPLTRDAVSTTGSNQVYIYFLDTKLTQFVFYLICLTKM